jgi:hypothetical protein
MKLKKKDMSVCCPSPQADISLIHPAYLLVKAASNSMPSQSPCFKMASPSSFATPTFGRPFVSPIALPHSHTARKSFDSGFNHITYASDDAGLLNVAAQLSQAPLSRQTRSPWYAITEYWRAFKSRWIMLVLFGIGCFAAVAHYAYYASLHGKEADRQLAVQYRGSAITYLAKVALVRSIIISFQQQMWLLVSREPLSIGSIDNFFAATSETMAFLDVSLWSKAIVSMLVAAIVWYVYIAYLLKLLIASVVG